MPEIVNGNPINEVEPHVSKSRSTIELEQTILDTMRFAEIHPHVVIDGVSSDNLPLRSSHNTRSYTLKSPLMQDIQIHKDYFLVNLRSILPLQGERFVTNPTIGDDIPADAYTSVSDFVNKIGSMLTWFMYTYPNSLDGSDPDDRLAQFTSYMKGLILAESVFSAGSLLSTLGCNLSRNLVFTNSDGDNQMVDAYLDYCVVRFNGMQGWRVTIDGADYTIDNTVDYATKLSNLGSVSYISAREFLCMIRDTGDWYFRYIPSAVAYFATFGDDAMVLSSVEIPIDLARVWAYQLVCAEFFTNDKVDYIYSAEIFRQYIWNLYCNCLSSKTSQADTTFTYNGSKLSYDYLSSHFFNLLVSNVSIVGTSASYLQYFLTLFGFNRSLRYVDYFVGSRTHPLAVGDTNIQVNSNLVSVLDVTRNIQVQRFLNAVNSVGRKFKEYINGLFGVTPDSDQHDPIFLAHTSDGLFASETENTGSAVFEDVNNINTSQNSVTAVFRSQSGNYEFSVSVKEPSIIIGVTSFDIKRSYSSIIEKSFFIRNRFDMFIPEMQFVGDQPVLIHELAPYDASAFGKAFGYQYHDMQYKQLINRSVGGFSAKMLPGYSFDYDALDIFAYGIANQSPDFIRAKQSELDDFYISLTGYSLGTYFHFITIVENTCKASRPMAIHPQILG